LYLPSNFISANQLETQNEFGVKQLDMDVQTDSLIYDVLKKSKAVHFALSEERPYPTVLNRTSGQHIVAFDPIDGSNVLDSNYSVGTIFGIWPNG